MSNQLPRIAVITLGGTIASVPDSSGNDAVPKMTAEALFDGVPQARKLATLAPYSFRQYPSGDLSLKDILELAGLIEDMAQAENIDGVVITQGTDTLEETSFLLDLLLTTDLPVVLTGAMRNPGLPGADGPANLLGAVQVATNPQSRGLGPVVVFNDEIHLPRFVRKMHSASTAAFSSPNAGPIGWINEGRVRIPLRPATRTRALPRELISTSRLPRVALLKLGLDAEEALIGLVLQDGFDGIVIETFGGGHVPRQLMPSLTAAADKIPVVFASRTGAGEVYESTYGFPGSEKDLLSRGLLSSGILDGLKSRLLLTLLLATGGVRDEISQRFQDFLS
ncbi:L-asparaginase [Arthrobacter sp. Hiyo4]|nr:L-asparaginase [Arthrobacter sp. Hiyo4]